MIGTALGILLECAIYFLLTYRLFSAYGVDIVNIKARIILSNLFLDMVCVLAGLVPLLGLVLSYAVRVLICLCVGLYLSIEILCGVMSFFTWMHTLRQLV